MNKKSIYLVVGIAIIGGVLALILWRGSLTNQGIQPTPQTPSQNVQSVPAIVKAVMSRSIDAKGNPTGETTTFNAKTDKIVYAVLTLRNVTKATKISYVRYLNGKYIDSKVAQPSKDGMTNFYFIFEKGIGDYPKGTYTLKLYLNGKRATVLAYAFK